MRKTRDELIAENLKMRKNCDFCTRPQAQLFTMRQRDDGTWYEVKDGTVPTSDDLEVCADCADVLERSHS